MCILWFGIAVSYLSQIIYIYIYIYIYILYYILYYIYIYIYIYIIFFYVATLTFNNNSAQS